MRGQQPSIFEATCQAMNRLASRGITGENVVDKLRLGQVPANLVDDVRLVHGKNASVRVALAKKAKFQS